ncbi:MAG: hypothetical protein IOC63_20875 [Methylobacterium sp.]|nr:hypothetical protein [Methylobacterium sp.]
MGEPLTEGNFLNLTPAELDQHIYRIMRESFVISLFADRTNVLSQVHNWKDKFENFQLNLGGKLNGEPFQYGFRSDFVGQCWTRENLSEAMWGIYANDPNDRFLRIRSTPRKVLAALVAAHPAMPQDTCFIGKVQYKREHELRTYVQSGGQLDLCPKRFASHLLLKRNAFKHESEVRLLYFGDAKSYGANGLYRYPVDPHDMITQIMADPNRNRTTWTTDKTALQRETGFTGSIKRSKIYDPPDWNGPSFHN